MAHSVMVLIRLKIGFLLLLHHSLHIDRAMSTNNYISSLCLGANYTIHGEFESNMHSVFNNLINAAHPLGFAEATAGEGPETVYGLVQCRRDIDNVTCNACISAATDQIVHPYCGTSMDAIIWYEKCQLRYSNTNFFRLLNSDDYGNSSTGHKAQDPEALYYKLASLLKSNLTSEATREPSGTMFATGEMQYTNLETLYGLVQCTGDTSLNDCKECLNSIISQIRSTCNGEEGCEIVTGSCRVRYDTRLFYGTTTTPTPSPPAPPSNGASNTTPGTGNIIIEKPIVISVLIAVLVITCAICGFCWWKREFCCFWRKKLSGLQGMAEEEAALEQQAFRRADPMDGPTFDLVTTRSATNNFALRNKLGEGGFGSVYRGQLLNGLEIAVKRLSLNTGHGSKQFDNEVQTLTKLQHRNLVRLLGGFMEGEEKILIYEYVSNGSLDNFLFGEPTKRMQLDWAVRSKLINGIARGVMYLHEDSRLRIVHRDLKASNILLDTDMNPKISDFGTAKIFDTDQTQTDTLEVMGTRGYMAPEYLLEGKVSVKIDVYSFGVLVLEIISGKKNFSLIQQDTDENLLNYVWRLWGENKALEVVDQTLEETRDSDEILRCIHIGLLCVQEDASSRPRMSKVVAMLENSSLILPSILPPAPPTRKIKNLSSGAQTSSTASGIGSELYSSSY
ncbi:cysteine-rich receptor-like protein kinase 15 [Nymphaea colorata]|nr:cysteine-rich receptor-like protein kinase 15 [Nymphaea colorata]